MWNPITGTTLDCLRKRWNYPDAVLDWISLSFYRQGILVRVSAEGDRGYCIAAGGGALEDAEWFMLDGTGGPIVAANKAAGLKLDADTILDYLRFFVNSMIADAVPMELADDVILEYPEGSRMETSGPVFNGMEEGKFLCTAQVKYGGGVFEVDYAISPDGLVDMEPKRKLEAVPVH